jgi:hypothetical protein
VNTWAPIFAIQMGIPLRYLEDLSVPQMVDHLDHWHEIMRGADG